MSDTIIYSITIATAVAAIVIAWMKFHHTIMAALSDISDKLDGRPKNLGRLREDLRYDLIAVFEKALTATQRALIPEKKDDEKSVIIHDFKAGWDVLFTDFFCKNNKSGRVLRDFTRSRYSETSFGSYNFETYPMLIRTHMQSDIDRRWQYRILVLCDSGNQSDNCNKCAQSYLEAALELKFIDQRLSFRDRFNEWKRTWERDGHSQVQIRLLGDTFLAARKSQAKCDSPFNVYGESAVSRSTLKLDGQWPPNPHLEIDLRKPSISSQIKDFDELWRVAGEFQKRLFESTSEHDLGNDAESGVLFRRWCTLV